VGKSTQIHSFELRASTRKARLCHGQFHQFPLGGTFDSSQPVSVALLFKDCNLREDPVQHTATREEWRSGLDSFTKVDGIVFPEPPVEEGLGPFPLRETHLYLPRGLLLYPWA
jgi:hypothetical protein